ncbi:IS3 family transposase [Priestia endophytica]|uniref:IS3 family transposase n=1 Tax=Priestia endophytica TaxID=135735 RepID=UPI001625FF35
MDSFFSHLKTENNYFFICETERKLSQAIHDYIWFYNYEQFRKKLNQCASIQYRNTLVA